MKRKLFAGLGSIAAILLLSSVISIIEYTRMSDYVSQRLADVVVEYDFQMPELFAVGLDSTKTGIDSSLMVFVVDSVATWFNQAVYNELKLTSEAFDAGYYRSIMPVVVAVGAGLLLVFLFLYFMMSYYVNPICRISEGIDNYRQSGRRHSYEFDGDDQVANINAGITELMEENIELKRRIRALKEDRNQ